MQISTVIYLVRHGHVHNPKAIHYGRLPRFALSEQGRSQARAAAQALRDMPLVAIFSSPLLRARQTAEIILEQHGSLSLRISHLLNEIHSPFDGCPRSEMEARNWDLYTGTKPPYEQPGDILERIRKFVMRIRRQYKGQHVVAATHGDTPAFFMLWAQGMPITAEYKQKVFPAPASITTFTYKTQDPDEVPSYQYLEPY